VPATLPRTPLPLRLPVETDEGAARRALRAQLGALERRLAATEEPLPAPRSRRGAPRLLDLAALERARDDLYSRVRAAERLAVEREAAHAAARARLEAMLADPAAHRWERVTREQLGEPGCGDWHVRPRAGLLGMLAGWWEVKLSSGCPLAGWRWHGRGATCERAGGGRLPLASPWPWRSSRRRRPRRASTSNLGWT
jgi:hypothetical protein